MAADRNPSASRVDIHLNRLRRLLKVVNGNGGDMAGVGPVGVERDNDAEITSAIANHRRAGSRRAATEGYRDSPGTLVDYMAGKEKGAVSNLLGIKIDNHRRRIGGRLSQGRARRITSRSVGLISSFEIDQPEDNTSLGSRSRAARTASETEHGNVPAGRK